MSLVTSHCCLDGISTPVLVYMIFYESKSDGFMKTFTRKMTSDDYTKTRTFKQYCVQFGKTWTQNKHKLYEVKQKPSVSWTLDFSDGTNVFRKVEITFQTLPDRGRKLSISTTF